jgi:hypothetical protein
MQKRKYFLKILILTALVATVSLGWLAGHILRYSNPEIWQPPVHIPGEKIVKIFKFVGFQHPGMPQELSPSSRLQSALSRLRVQSVEGCAGNTYYTSLPAKCRNLNGELVQLRPDQRGLIIVP